jgi:hypothetical protein
MKKQEIAALGAISYEIMIIYKLYSAVGAMLNYGFFDGLSMSEHLEHCRRESTIL